MNVRGHAGDNSQCRPILVSDQRMPGQSGFDHSDGFWSVILDEANKFGSRMPEAALPQVVTRIDRIVSPLNLHDELESRVA